MTNSKKPAGNSRFAKAGVSCFYYIEVLNSSFVHLIEFSAKNPRLRKAAKRYHSVLELAADQSLCNRCVLAQNAC